MDIAEKLTRVREERHGRDACAKLAAACVGIAGLGGLGSHIAIALTRMGIGHLVLADDDLVDASNLHRQNYAISDIGLSKTTATARILRAVDPNLKLSLHNKRITKDNAAQCFASCNIVCEAFDDPAAKAMLIETLLNENNDLMIVAGSGMAGLASGNIINTKRMLSRLYIAGDGKTDVNTDGHLYAARVALCANHQALMTLRLLLGYFEP